MVPRAEIIAVDESIALAELLKLFREAQHSRLPVFRETLDDPTGLIHVKDVLGAARCRARRRLLPAPNARSPRCARPILFVPPSMRALDLLLKMQATHTHLALVIDEYGGTDGLVSIEDIIEEIVGDIADEHDEDAAALKPDGDSYIADARMDLDDFKTETGHDFPARKTARMRRHRQSGRAGGVAAGPGAAARRDHHPSRRQRIPGAGSRSAPGAQAARHLAQAAQPA